MSQNPHDRLLDLFDIFWTQYPIFSKKPSLPPPSTPPGETPEELPGRSKLPDDFPPPLHHVRSMSDTDIRAPETGSPLSPDSVLSATPKLETILSGKDAGDFFGAEGSSLLPDVGEEVERPGSKRREARRTRRGRRREKGIVRTGSRSLSELEFQELKGFMDLGFVFSEQDRDSALASILPGLQRLGINENGGGASNKSDRNGEEGVEVVKAGVSRPYLSEAWGVSERRRKALMNWRIPELGNNEVAMKDHLRFWAHAVASTVR